jgi:4-amino-4-deoxy-L-arabinose transferase-like glycosyltransferase
MRSASLGAVARGNGAAPGGLNGLQRQTGWPDRAIVAAILALVLLRLLVAASSGLTDDEAYYRLWSLAPAMGYLDHAPMIAWMIAAGRWLAGDNPLGVRLGGILTSLIGPFILWRTAGLLFGPAIAKRAVWIALAMPLLAVGGVIVTPDTPSVLFWGLAAWALAECHVSRNANWWLAVGAFAGLGLLSKYTNLFAGAGILLWLLLIPANWLWFRAWQLWAGGAIAAVIALPVVLWNAEHGWVSFAKQFGRVGAGQQLTAVYFGELVGAFFGLASPIIAALALIGLVRVVRSAANSKDQSDVMLAASVLPLLAYFLVHSLHDRVQPNWVAPLYASFAICAAIALAHIEGPRPDGAIFGWLGRSAVALGFVMSAILYLHAVTPLIPSAKDPSAQMRGWRELAQEVDRMRVAKGACWVATSNYATTGQLAYELARKAPVVQLTERTRYLNLPPVDPALFKCPALYVELERRASPSLLQERFRNVTFLTNVVRANRGTALATYPVYLVSDPVADRLLTP